jgi:hypothetical protein
MKGAGLKSNKDKKYNDKFWDKLDKLEKIDSDIALEVRKGKRVTILEDSENDIDIPDYPGDY